MQPTAQTQPSPPASSFAGLLAALTSPAPKPKPKPEDEAPLWSSEELGDDVATLSYERALRAHARYKPSDLFDASQQQQSAAGKPAAPRTDAAAETVAEFSVPSLAPQPTAPGRDLRLASVTIRLSKGECERLHKRAAEAGLTVSAYLRSCTFEVETLRAQVKEAVAQMRNSTTQEKPTAPAAAKRSWRGWLSHRLLRRMRRQSASAN
jgi:predicted DNA binding CopG/RHH family protein